MKKKMMIYLLGAAMLLSMNACGKNNDSANASTLNDAALAESAAQDEVIEEIIAEISSQNTDVSYESGIPNVDPDYIPTFEKSRTELSMEILHMPLGAIEEEYGFCFDDSEIMNLYLEEQKQFLYEPVEKENIILYRSMEEDASHISYIELGNDSAIDFFKEYGLSSEMTFTEAYQQLTYFGFSVGGNYKYEDAYVQIFNNPSMKLVLVSENEDGSHFYFYIGLPQ